MRFWHSFGMRPLTLCTGRFWAAQGRHGSAAVPACFRLPAGARLGLAALQVVPEGGRQAVLPGFLGRLGRSIGMPGRLWLIGRHRGPLAKLRAELADPRPRVNRCLVFPRQRRGGRLRAHPSGAGRRGYPGGGAAGSGTAATSRAWRRSWSFSPGRIGARCPRSLGRWLPAGHDRTMAELWKIDESR